MYGRTSYLLLAYGRSQATIRAHQLRTHQTRPTTARPTTSRQFAYAGSKRRGL